MQEQSLAALSCIAVQLLQQIFYVHKRNPHPREKRTAFHFKCLTGTSATNAATAAAAVIITMAALSM